MLFFNNKKTFIESGVLTDYTDRHTHILPGVDDGIKTLDDSLTLLSQMEEAGISEVWLTPHIMEDIPNDPADLKAKFAELQAAYKGDITLHLAAEHMLDPLFTERFKSHNVLPMEDNILLVETSYFNPPLGFEDILKEIMMEGYQPLLAHPERYKYLEMSDYARLKGYGVLFQLNLGALAGGYSPETQKKAKEILKRGWYDCSGSDVHAIRQFGSIISTPVNKNIISQFKAIPNKLNPLP